MNVPFIMLWLLVAFSKPCDEYVSSEVAYNRDTVIPVYKTNDSYLLKWSVCTGDLQCMGVTVLSILRKYHTYKPVFYRGTMVKMAYWLQQIS